MVGTLIGQPNDKYCIINCLGEVTHYNLTEQDVINMYIKDAKACIRASEHYGNIIAKATDIPDDILKDMGFDRPYNELIKFVPRKPTNQHYVSCDFTTYGKCPNCGEVVMNSIGGMDTECRNCEQLLQW